PGRRPSWKALDRHGRRRPELLRERLHQNLFTRRWISRKYSPGARGGPRRQLVDRHLSGNGALAKWHLQETGPGDRATRKAHPSSAPGLAWRVVGFRTPGGSIFGGQRTICLPHKDFDWANQGNLHLVRRSGW